MSDAATASVPTTQPAPEPAGVGSGGRVGRLLNLVRRLIDYGKELASTLQQRSTTTVVPPATHSFGTSDIGLILARIIRGLHRADALEARLVRHAAGPDAAPRPPATAKRSPRAARPSPRRTDAADTRLPRLPTPEQIAAEVRRRPIGVVIADICRDLGILPSHPMWRELQLAIIEYGGSLAALFKDMCQRVFQTAAPGGSIPAPVVSPAAACTGPP